MNKNYKTSFSEKNFKPTLFNKFMSIFMSGLVFVSPMQVLLAAPSGGVVVGGDSNATITQNGNTTTVDQFANKAIIDWQKFGINQNEIVKFNQIDNLAVILNRVTGTEASNILGQLVANGNVFIINPNGILFGKDSSVDVAGLVATTMNIKNDDFLNGDYKFAQDGEKLGYVVNQGKITVGDNGFVYLLAPGVENSGIIVAKSGSVALASGTEATVDFTGSGLVKFKVSGKITEQIIGPDGKPMASSVSNSGQITTEGGQVLLSGDTARDVLTSVINNSGVIEANSLGDVLGSVSMQVRDEGNISNSGSISAIGTKSGTVNISGGGVDVAGSILAGDISIENAKGISVGGSILATSTASLSAKTGGISTTGNGVIVADTLNLKTEALADSSIGTVSYVQDSTGNQKVVLNALNTKANTINASTVSGTANGVSTGNIIIDNKSTNDLVLGKITTNGDKGDNDIATVVITTGGKLLDKGTTSVDAFSASLSAANDINLNTNLTSLKVVTTNSGNIAINNVSDTLYIMEATAREYGNIALLDGNGSIKVFEGTDYRDGTKNISIKSTGDIGVQGNITATKDVKLESTAGSIYNVLNESAQPSVMGDAISLNAAGSVGQLGNSMRTVTGTRLDINSGTIKSLDDKEVGGVVVEELNHLNIGSIVAKGIKSDVHLTATKGNAYFSQADSKILADGGTVTINASQGNIIATLLNQGNIIEAEKAILSGKAVGLAVKSLNTKVNSLDVISTDIDYGYINIVNATDISSLKIATAGKFVKVDSAGMDLLFDANEQFSISNGTSSTVDFANTSGNIKLSDVNLGGNDLTLNAAKAITQSSGRLVAGNLKVVAGDNIGSSSSAIQTKVSSLDLTSGKNGIYVEQESAGALTLNAIASGNSSDISVKQTGVGNMEIKKVSSAKGGVTLESSGSMTNGNASLLEANVVGNSLSLTAAGAVGDKNKSIITKVSKQGSNADLTVNAAAGGVYLENTGAINLNASTSGSGDISLNNTGNVAMGVVNAGDKNIKLKINGTLTDANADALNVTAKDFNLRANSVGASTDALDISVEKLDVATSNGALYLKQLGNTDFYLVYAAAIGTASIEAGGNIYLGVIEASGQNVTLKSSNGDILDNRILGEKKANVTAKNLEITGKNLGTDDKRLSLDVGVLSSSSGGSVFAENLGTLLVTSDSLTGKGAGQKVSITASSITVFDNNGGTTTLDNNGSLELIAKNGNIVFLNTKDTVEVTGTGSIYLEALGTNLPEGESGLVGLIVAGNLKTGGGDITLKAASHISINLLNAASGNVVVQSNNGLIIDNNGADVNIIAKGVVLSGKTLSDVKLDDDKKIAISDVGDRNIYLKLQQLMKENSELKVAAGQTSVDELMQTYNNFLSDLESKGKDLTKAEKEAEALYWTFYSLNTALNAANLVASVLEIPAGAAQAIPVTGDAGSALGLGIANSVLAGMQLGVDAASVACDKADAKASDLAAEISSMEDRAFATKQDYETHSDMLNTEKVILANLTEKVAASKIALDASKQIEKVAYQAAANNNVIGSSTQALGVQAERVDVSAFGQSNVYLESPANIGLGDITAQGKNTVIEVHSKGDMALQGLVNSSKNIVLSSETGAITATKNSKLTSGDLVVVAKKSIGSDSAAVHTSVNRIAAASEEGGAFFKNENATEALSIDEISVDTSNVTKTVTGISAKGNILVETSDDLILNKAVKDTSKVSTVTLTASNGAITATGDNPPAYHVEGGTLVAKSADGIGTQSAALRTDVSKITADVTKTGSINIVEKDAVELTSVTANDGSIVVKAGASIDAKNVVSVKDSEGNTIELNASTGNITAGTISAGALNGNITVNALEGQVNNDGNLSTLISGKDLTIGAKSGIGAVGANNSTSLDTDVASIVATTQTGVVNISEKDNLDVKKVTTGDGNVTIASAGGDLNITNIAANGAGNTLTLDAFGAITDDTKDETNAIIKASNLSAKAGKGIGSASNFIELNVDAMEANTTSGGIFVSDLTGDLKVGGVTPNLGKPALVGLNADSGDVVVNVKAGELNITEAVLAKSGKTELTASDSITASATVTAKNDILMTAQAGDIATTAAVTSTAGKVAMTADQNITTDGTVSADQEVSMTATNGAIATTKAIESANANIAMTAGTSITTDATVTANQDVLMTAQTGNIATTEAVTSTAGKVAMTADQNITTDGTVSAAQEVSMTATKGAIATTKAIESANANIAMTAGTSITTDATVTAKNDVLMTAQNGNILANKAIESKTANVALTASDSIKTTDTVTAKNDILMTAQAGDIATTAAVTSTAGKVAMTADQNITTDGTVSAAQEVSMTATKGAIATTKAIESANANIAMTAGTSITTDAAVTAKNDILMTAQAGDIATTEAVTSTAGKVAMTADQNITTDGTVSAAQEVSMTATNGAIATTKAIESANANIAMTAGTSITTDATVTAKNEVSMTAQNGNILANKAIESKTANVALTASDSIKTTDTVTANQDILMTAQAGDIATTAAVTSTAGKVAMTADQNITTDGTVSAAQEVSMTATKGAIATTKAIESANANIEMTAGTSITTDATVTAKNDILMTAQTGNIATTEAVTSTAGKVAMTEATKGAIIGTSTNPPVFHIEAKKLTATAETGIGTASTALRTNIDKLVAETTGAGNISIAQTGAIDAEAKTANGSISILADGTITATNIVSKTDTDANDITLRATTGDVLVKNVVAGAGKAADVNLTADNGKVITVSPDGNPVVGDMLNIVAKIGIDLDTTVKTVNAVNTGDGSINIDESDDLVIKNAQTNGRGSITAKVDGELEALIVTAKNGLINLSAKNNLIARNVVSSTNSVGNDINLNSDNGDIIVDYVASGTGTGGKVNLTASQGSIRESDPNDADVDLIGSTVNLHAKGDIGVGESGGLKISSEVLNAYSTDGNISLADDADVVVNELHAANGTVKITAGGYIADDNNDSTGIIAKDLILEAVSGIGTKGSALDTKVGTLSASVSNAGGINVAQSGDIVVKNMQTFNGDINLDVDIGNVAVDTIVAKGNGNTVSLKASNGAITDYNDHASRMRAAAPVNIVSDKVVLEASNGVGVDNSLEISTGEISAEGGNGGLNVTNLREGLVINEFTTNKGDLILTTLGALQINNPVSNLGGGDISFTTTDTGKNTDNIIINASVSATGNGSVSFNANDSFYQNANINVERDGDINVIAGDSIFMNNGTNSTAKTGNITYDAANELQLGNLTTSTTPQGGKITINSPTIINNNPDKPALEGAFFDINTQKDTTKEFVLGLIANKDNAYGIWINSRLVGGLDSQDAAFLDKTRFDDVRHDLGYQLLYKNYKYDVLPIDASIYQKGGFIYDKESDTWKFAPKVEKRDLSSYLWSEE